MVAARGEFPWPRACRFHGRARGIYMAISGDIFMAVDIRVKRKTILRWLRVSAIVDGTVGVIISLYNLNMAFTYMASVKAGLVGVTAHIGYGLIVLIVGSISV